MGIFHLIMGFMMIGIGFLVKTAPELIAGYNTMPKAEKENVDIEGLSTLMRNGFILIGLIIISGYYFFYFAGLTLIANSMAFIALFGGLAILIIKAQKYDHNPRKKPVLILSILGIIALGVTIMLYFGCASTKTTISGDVFRISGMYGFEMKASDISKVELLETIPVIEMRTNGFSFNGAKKGTFRLAEYGKCKLFVDSDKGPFLVITSHKGERTILSSRNPIETKENFEKIRLLTE